MSSSSDRAVTRRRAQPPANANAKPKVNPRVKPKAKLPAKPQPNAQAKPKPKAKPQPPAMGMDPSGGRPIRPAARPKMSMIGRLVMVFVFAGVGFGLGWVWGGYDDPALVAAQDKARARFAELRPQAQAGDPNAQFAVAEHYRLGLGVEVNPAASSVWYRKAAEQVHAEAAFALARLYEAGRGVPRDYGEAALWYGVAADLGDHAKAQYALAMMHYHGRGFAPDPARAFELYQAAAEHGYAPAQHMLGAIYEHGWGIEPDAVAAYAWYSLAIAGRDEVRRMLPDQDPVAARRELAERMTKFRISQAERKAAAWRPTTGTDIVPAAAAAVPPRSTGSVRSAAQTSTTVEGAASRPWPFVDAPAP